LLAILATVGILKRVAFEFPRGVRRGLNAYLEGLPVESRAALASGRN